jgi:outer membrane lipoprotein-sorting protein
MLAAWLLAALLVALPAAAHAAGAPAALEPAPPDLDARDIARRAEASLRADRTYLEAKLTVESPGFARKRVVAFRSWDDRAERRSFIRILSPAKDSGTGFLKLPPNLWMHVPRTEQTMRIPPPMLREPWMGSDFSHDDLVHASSEIEDYDHTLLGIDPRPQGADGVRAYVVEYTPRAGTPIAWGKILTWIETEHGAPLRREFYDENGEKRRVLTFGDVREVEGRHVPHLWTMRPLREKGHETRIQLDRIQFDPSFDDGVFTTRQLTTRQLNQ